MLIPRKKYNEDRKVYWEKAEKVVDDRGSLETVSMAIIIALLTDMHTMFESITVEPEIDDL